MPTSDRTATLEGRIARARTVMDDRGVDTMLLSLGADLPYLTGYDAMPLERLTMLVLSTFRDDVVLVVPELEAPRVEEGPFELRPWSETENPVEVVARLAGRPTVAAIGDQTWSVFLLELMARMTQTTFVSAGDVMRELRIIKDGAEIEALGRAARAADRVMERIPAEVRFAGRTEHAVSRDIVDMLIEEGHEMAAFWIVATGPNAASPHHEPGDREIRDGDAVVLDFGGRLDGYCSDISRTFSVGSPSSRLLEVHAVVREAQAAGRNAVEPGVPAEEVDRAARRVIESAGLGDRFIHRTGHGIGLEGHEDPYLVEGNQTALRPGMAFSIEPGVYLEGELGVRIEDICVVAEAGVDVLNDAERDLIVLQ